VYIFPVVSAVAWFIISPRSNIFPVVSAVVWLIIYMCTSSKGRCTHVYKKPCHSTDYWEDVTPGANNKPCHSTDYWEDVTPRNNNKPCHNTDYREHVHMYLINLATALTTGKMYTYI
jgi:hypothetical protein